MTREPVQSVWIGDHLGKLEQLSICSFLANGHPFHLYTYGMVTDVPAGTVIMDADAILPRKRIFRRRDATHRVYANFTDWFRWELLYRRGGWWVDIDTICLRPFYFEQEAVFMSDSPAVLKFPIGHQITKLLANHCARPARWMPWDDYKQRFKKISCRLLGRYRRDIIPSGQSGGPEPFREALKYFGLLNKALPRETFDPLSLMSYRQALAYIDNRTLPEAFFSHSHTIKIDTVEPLEDANKLTNVSISIASHDQPSTEADVSGQVMQALWVGGRLSKLEQLCVRSFLSHGHPFHLYTYGQVADVPTGATIMDANAILPQTKVFQHRRGEERGSYTGFSDWFRWELLYRRGGWWVDMDLVCLHPFDFKQEIFFMYDYDASAHNGLMKFPAGHRLPSLFAENCAHPGKWLPYDDLYTCFKKIYYFLMGQHRSYSINWGQAGGLQPFTNAVRHFKLSNHGTPPEPFLAIDSIPRQILCLFQSHQDDLIDRIQRGCYTVHFYNELLRRMEQDGLFAGKDANYPADSLFETLKRRYEVA